MLDAWRKSTKKTNKKRGNGEETHRVIAIAAAIFGPTMNPDLIYQLALTQIPQVGPVQAKILLQHLNVNEIFHTKRRVLEKIEGIGSVRAASIVSFRNFSRAEQEIRFIEKYQIKPLFITDEKYPRRLLNCYDSPILLFYKGEADLNAQKIISVIGTRNHSEYGKQTTERFIKELAEQHITVISGLAFGIDAIAHKACLKNQMATVGVLAHGLDQVYPSEHTTLAREMVKNNGGLLTEFPSNSKPDKHNFPSRNRIVAGMSDAVIVIETGLKGGSLITADLANGYNKDVFAVPGRITEHKSAGCHELIRNNKAQLITSATELVDTMQWNDQRTKSPKKIQRELFIEMSKEERIIVDILKEKGMVHIDEINMKAGLSSSAIANAILSLEMQTVVVGRPGKMYALT
jgi:DNA processing protein